MLAFFGLKHYQVSFAEPKISTTITEGRRATSFAPRTILRGSSYEKWFTSTSGVFRIFDAGLG